MIPDREIGTFTPQQAREVWDTTKLLRSSGLLRNLSKLTRPAEPGLDQVFVKNTETEHKIPPFGCMQITGTEVSGEYTYITVKRPTETNGYYLFNHDNEIEEEGFGMALPWGIVRMLAASAEPNKQYGPVIDSWEIARQDSGPFVVYGPDNTRTGIAKGRITGGARAQIIQFSLGGQEDYPDDYEYGDEELCANRDNAEPPYYGEVVKVACGASRPVFGEDEEGMVELADDLGILENRDRKQLANKTGIAVLLSDGESEYAECYWCIIYIDFHREIQVVTDIIFQSNMIVVERKLIKVWDDCKLPDEEIEGIDCDEDEYYYGGGI